MKNFTDGPWTKRFDDTGGYDCMTGAWLVESGSDLICKVDQTDFGQKSCDYEFRSEDAKRVADLIVKAPAMAKLLARVMQFADLPPGISAEIKKTLGE